jgi:hypothetical protein
MKKFLRLLSLTIVGTSILVGQVFFVGAQAPSKLPLQVIPTTEVVSINATKVPFGILQEEEMVLTGPFDAADLVFAIPDTWRLSTGTQLFLSMTVNFNRSFFSEFGYPVAASGGTLSVYLNDNLLGMLNLNQAGQVESTLPIPLDAFVSERPDRHMEFYVELDAADFCYVDEAFTLVIHSASYFDLPHQVVKSEVDLTRLPTPLYQNTFIPEAVLLVVPDQPSAAELQAALTIAAGLGNFSQNNLALDLTTMSALTTLQMASNHIVLVGKASSLNLTGLELPLKPSGGQFSNFGGAPEDGIIQMINSPWDISRVILHISGNTDAGIIKAAQAFSTGVLLPNRLKNLAIVEEIRPPQGVPSIPEKRTLAEMGYENLIFAARGFRTASYTFQIPPGWTVTSDAYFELVFGNSALVDFEQSGINVLLNGRPIGSVRLDAETAKNSINRVKMALPEFAILPGTNRLEIQITLVPAAFCAPPDIRGLWATVWNESVLNAPITQQPIDFTTTLGLADYPAPFTYNLELGTMAFVFSRNDLEAWRGAAKIASYLAYRTGTSIVMLSVFYGDELPMEVRANYNFLLIGRPSQLSVINDLNQYLPVPFDENDIVLENSLRVRYNIPVDNPLGYIEFLPSPWNSENVIITLLGNSQQGVSLATLALTDDLLRPQVSGNFVVVNGSQIIASDTRIFPIAGSPTVTSDQQAAVIPTMGPDSEMLGKQYVNWIPSAIFVLTGIIVVILAIVIIRPLRQRRIHERNQSRDE